MATFGKNTNNQTRVRQLSEFVSQLSPEEQHELSELLNDVQKKEQRKHPRTPCSIITEYIVNNRTYKGTIKDISLGGAFITARHVVPINRKISQSFFFPNFEIPIRSKSKIVWVDEQGFGVQFDVGESEHEALSG
jgi:hypothetical protein